MVRIKDQKTGEIKSVGREFSNDILIHGFERAASLPNNCSFSARCVKEFRGKEIPSKLFERDRFGNIKIPKLVRPQLMIEGGKIFLNESRINDICTRMNTSACNGGGSDKAFIP